MTQLSEASTRPQKTLESERFARLNWRPFCACVKLATQSQDRRHCRSCFIISRLWARRALDDEQSSRCELANGFRFRRLLFVASRRLFAGREMAPNCAINKAYN